MSITNEVIQIFDRAESSNNCVIISFIHHKEETCATTPLVPPYDAWINTPEHNTFAFYSDQPRALNCSGVIEKISPSSGIVRLDQTCLIKTTTKFILPSNEKMIFQRKIYKFDTQQSKLLTSLDSPHTLNQTKYKRTGKFDKTLLNEAVGEAESIPLTATSWTTILATGSLSALSILLILSCYFIYFKLKNNKTHQSPIPAEVETPDIDSQIRLSNLSYRRGLEVDNSLNSTIPRFPSFSKKTNVLSDLGSIKL